MDPFMIHILGLMIFSSFGFPMFCGAVGEFAVNIAYGKPATQSSTYIGIKGYGETPGYPYNASLAVDGNTDTNFKRDGCSLTDVNSNSVWWEVDLMDLYNVLNITIYQRSDANIHWLSGFVTKGKLSNDSFVIIDNPKSNMDGTITIPVNTNLKYKGIRIELTKTNEHVAICLCEVEVLAEINVAEKKLAKQSSSYYETSTHFSASLAVDGNTNTNFAENSCSCTNPGDLNPWWSVELQAVYFVIGIRIYQRMDGATAVIERLKGFTLVGVHTDGSTEKIQTPQLYQTGEIIVRVEPPRMLREIRVHLNHSDAKEPPIITLCEVQVFAGTMCPKPPAFPRNGLYKFIPGNEGNWSYNFSLIIQCMEEYIIDGPISVRCVDINRWNGTFGLCSVKRCNQPLSQVAHGILTFKDGIDGNGTYNTTVTLNCSEGHNRIGDEQLRCADEDQWQGKLGNCTVKRCNQPLSQVEHGILTFKNGIDGNGTYNTTVTLNCIEGYNRIGVGQLRCADGDQWQGTLGHCIVIDCGQPMNIPNNSTVISTNGLTGNTSYNATMRVVCDKGLSYTLSGNDTIRCNDDGKWIGILGQCKVTRCTAIVPHEYGVIVVEAGTEGRWSFNTTVAIICNTGYSLNGKTLIKCLETGRWTNDLGYCLALQKMNTDDDESKTSLLAWVIAGPLCLIFLVTNIATCFRLRRHTNSNMDTLKNKSNESENNAMEPYVNLQMETRAQSEYDQLTFERESSLKRQ